MADTPFSRFGPPRRAPVFLTTSNASLPIPVWAQGGKGILLVTGVGAGAGGGNSQSGGAGASAYDFPLPIPAGATTVNAVVGVGGAGNPTGAGADGGSTEVRVGAFGLQLGGGGAAALGGAAAFWNNALSQWIAQAFGSGGMSANGVTWASSLNFRVTRGAQPGNFEYTSSGATSGAMSPFGAPGGGTQGAGYGYGGRLGMTGGNGMLLLEFVEGT